MIPNGPGIPHTSTRQAAKAAGTPPPGLAGSGRLAREAAQALISIIAASADCDGMLAEGDRAQHQGLVRQQPFGL